MSACLADVHFIIYPPANIYNKYPHIYITISRKKKIKIRYKKLLNDMKNNFFLIAFFYSKFDSVKKYI